MKAKFNALKNYESLTTNFNALRELIKFEAYDVGILNKFGKKTVLYVYNGKKICCSTYFFMVYDLEQLKECKHKVLGKKKINMAKAWSSFTVCQEINVESAERFNKNCKICKEDGALAKQ